MAPSTTNNDTRILTDLITSTLALLGQFSKALTSTETPSSAPPQINNPPNPLRILSDSAKLVKAHTTKLSLLAINKPFTPTAITKILQELSATCLPAMMSAAQMCEQEKRNYGTLMQKEVEVRVNRVFRELETLLEEIRSIAGGGTLPGRRDSLSSTGVLWESCDALVGLERLGIAGLAVEKAQQYQETIKDALKELQEWKEGTDLDFEGQGDGLADSDDEAVDGDKDSLDDMFNAQNSMPMDRPELVALVEESESKLKKVVILYQALVKRRIKQFNNHGAEIADMQQPVLRLDELMGLLRKMPHGVDDMIGQFYELNEGGAKETLDTIMLTGRTACERMTTDWTCAEDEFAIWLQKWIAAVG